MLGPFALTQQLRPLLQAAKSARVVTVASVMHRKAALPADLDSFFTCAPDIHHRGCAPPCAGLDCHANMPGHWYSLHTCHIDKEIVSGRLACPQGLVAGRQLPQLQARGGAADGGAAAAVAVGRGGESCLSPANTQEAGCCSAGMLLHTYSRMTCNLSSGCMT